MKKIILIALAFISIQVIAQERRGEHRKDEGKQRTSILKDLSAEEAATLKTKKMVLQLDLTEAQQKEIHKLNLANAKERKAKREELKESDKKLSKEDRYNMMNERLDKQIAMKRKMKSILSEEQYKRFERGTKQKKMRSKKAVKVRSKKLRSGKS